jgi:hypothetical protein
MEEKKPEVKKEEDQVVGIITKRPPHTYSITLNENGKKAKYDFNSKEAMCIFIGSRHL